MLIPLTTGRSARYQRYDWLTGALATGEVHVPRSGTVIVEGVYSARPELLTYYDLSVYVDAPREVCLRRQLDREHDHGPGNWAERWRAAEEHYIAATNPQARTGIWVRGY